ncbi:MULTISPECIES: DUF6274 family protein [Streptomyces]|uniref:Uncharacterized protein n=1 Tax=Streptomyces dengpaensis TaxID=2049881 RepID=A0ABN5I4P9_9ACTN|nr:MULTISPECIES: DUF6274 family protein [Streptomyces]AVH57851.1 hypothetical protein C4B68_21115 [Streptomyces dengpaensis]PIB04851.1 hypothetical protein B1C81_31420 [Streptomyces sp. HG99]
MAASARHETRALLRAHLSAASGYRHLTRHCPICHQLLRLAMEPAPRDEQDAESVATAESVVSVTAAEGITTAASVATVAEDESPSTA